MNKKQSKQINTFASMFEMPNFFPEHSIWATGVSRGSWLKMSSDIKICIFLNWKKHGHEWFFAISLLSLQWVVSFSTSQGAETFISGIMSMWELQITFLKVIYFYVITQKRLHRKLEETTYYFFIYFLGLHNLLHLSLHGIP